MHTENHIIGSVLIFTLTLVAQGFFALFFSIRGDLGFLLVPFAMQLVIITALQLSPNVSLKPIYLNVSSIFLFLDFTKETLHDSEVRISLLYLIFGLSAVFLLHLLAPSHFLLF